jgi:hypothetical protein
MIKLQKIAVGVFIVVQILVIVYFALEWFKEPFMIEVMEHAG